MSADPVKRTVLLLGANPASTECLDLQREREAIEQSLARVPAQHSFRVVAMNAVTDDDLRRALLDHEPEIVHFSGHGTGRRGLVFEEGGEPLFIAGDALAGLLSLFSSHVKCVVLNACYSEVQAQSIGCVVDFVIGMSRSIGDNAAIKFSVGFYDALAAGRSFADAFHLGCNAISLRGIPESLTPTLITKIRPQVGRTSASAAESGELTNANVREVGVALDPSIKELISVLDFRADMILSKVESENGEAVQAVAKSVATEPNRDMSLRTFENRLSQLAAKFSELHEQNKKALIQGKFLLSHEITRQIQELLSAMSEAIFSWHEDERRKRGISILYFRIVPEPWTWATEYPGPLPQALKNSSTQIVLMWKREEEERERKRIAKEERALDVARTRDAEILLRDAERAKKREIVSALQEAAIAKGTLKEGDRCPKCGFSFGWVVLSATIVIISKLYKFLCNISPLCRASSTE